MAMALERELTAYETKLPELKEHEGKFALFHGDQLVDVFGTYEDALKHGYSTFGLAPFLVKQIHGIEQLGFISRLMDPAVPHPLFGHGQPR